MDVFFLIRNHQEVAYAILNDWLRNMPDSIDVDKTCLILCLCYDWKGISSWANSTFLETFWINMDLRMAVKVFVGSFFGATCCFFSYHFLAGWSSTMKYFKKLRVQSTCIFSFVRGGYCNDFFHDKTWSFPPWQPCRQQLVRREISSL